VKNLDRTTAYLEANELPTGYAPSFAHVFPISSGKIFSKEGIIISLFLPAAL